MDQLETWFHERFQEVHDRVTALPHADDFVHFCSQRRLRTFVLSTVREEAFAIQARLLGFEGRFERLYLGVWDKRQRIAELVAENNLRPEETLFIGDMRHDVETAKHGGVRSCAVLTGYNRHAQLKESEPDLIVEHLGELRVHLESSQMAMPASNGRHRGKAYPIPTVGALIFDDQDRALLVRTQKWSDLWGIPGGKIKWGEASEAALRRELLEETGLSVNDIRFVMVQDCARSKEFYRDEHFLLLNYTCRVVGDAAVRLNEEAQAFQWLRLEEARALPLNQPTLRLIETVAAPPPPLQESL